MKQVINRFIDKIKDMPFTAKVGLYVIVYIISHFSISLIYQLAMYNYSIKNSIPYLYASQVTVLDILPSLIYLKIPYLIISLLLYFGSITLVTKFKLNKNKDGFFSKKYDKFINKVSTQKAHSGDMYEELFKTKSGINLFLFSFFIFLLYVTLTKNVYLQEPFVQLIQFSVPIYFGYKFSKHKDHYLTLFFSILPILLFTASWSLFISPIFNRVMIENRIGGNIGVKIYDKVNRKPIEAKLLLLTNENVILDHLGYIKILNKKDLGTINFTKK